MKIIFSFRTITVVCLLLVFYQTGHSQIVINEFMASNTATIADPQLSEYSDWIELYNTGNTAVNLDGYFITDNLNRPEKWELTGNITIPSHGFLLIWADGDSIGVHTPFKLAQEGEEIGIFSPSLDLIDSITFSAQFTDISFGRQTNGSSSWGFFPDPTPGSSNNTTPYTGLVDNTPEFSLFGGLFSSPQQVTLSTPFGGTIRYTTDGSDPETSSPAYSGPLNINTTTVLRARVFKTNLIPGSIITNTYFLNEGLEERGLPVFSIATNPGNFWDPSVGIYVQDFKPDWEVPINIELFENDGSDRAAVNELAGTKVNGLYSWQLPQKMLGVYFRKQYGTSKLAYPLIFDRDRSGYKTFALRASGSDWSYTMFRDAMIQTSTPYNMNLDIMGYRPSILFVNGEYMGINNIREKIEEDYIVQHYGLASGSFDMVEYEDFAEAGDLIAYNAFKSLYSRDLSAQSNYDAVAAIMDIENYTDYIAAEIYSGNYSIDHNVMTWKPRGSGKWRWILMDLDRGFFDPSQYLIEYFLNQSVWPLSHLMQNQGYRSYFGKRLADQVYTTFNAVRIKEQIDNFQQRIEKEMPYHIARWMGSTSDYGDAIPSMDYWYQEINNLKAFAEARPQIIVNDLQNYGFSASANLGLSVSPSNAGFITLNALNVPGPFCTGPYPMNIPIELVAGDKPGYDFIGWAQPVKQALIAMGTEWKYLDNGSNQGSAWHDSTFNDNSWQAGLAEFGYGDGGEQTIISYGSDANSKYITTYFRKLFQLTASDLASSTFMINLLYDDGAVVFLNGIEIIRSNMPSGTIGYQTLANSSISGSAETDYTSYAVDASFFRKGNNILAVEVHQSAVNSSDLSFDLELIANKPPSGSYVSTSRNFSITLTEDRNLIALYESNGECIIPAEITSDLTLRKDCSPYVAQGDITVAPGVTLTIEPGVEIRMPGKGNMFIYGDMQATGTETERILFTMSQELPAYPWGALCFLNSPDLSKLSYVTIEHASEGPQPITEVAAISTFATDLELDHMIIEDVNHDPVAARYSSVVLTNSSLHSEIVGSNLINVKYGHARVENCTFWGNEYSDVDAIDYDDVEGGIIRNCMIFENSGFNSDGIDIGEQSTNIEIDSVLIYNMSDKGISIGQQSTVIVRNCIFVNCNLGIAVKDSSKVHADHCTFYGTGTPVACFEKIAGRAGGNAYVKNCVLSNSYDQSFLVDSRSTWQINYSLSDNDSLPQNNTNLFGNPVFENPTNFDFRLMPSSPGLVSGSDNGTPAKMGSLFEELSGEPSLMFSYIFCNPANNPEKSEFIGIYNPSSENVSLMNDSISMGISYVFKPVVIGPKETIFLVKDNAILSDSSFNGQSFQWSSGSLANEGETIRLANKYGIVLDQVYYKSNPPWPNYNIDENAVLSLISPDLDNHFGTSWNITDYDEIVNTKVVPTEKGVHIYPNPSTGEFNVKADSSANKAVEIYSVTGNLMSSFTLDSEGYSQIDLTSFGNGVYIIKVGDEIQKLILLNR
jgi:hypothetical protein